MWLLHCVGFKFKVRLGTKLYRIFLAFYISPPPPVQQGSEGSAASVSVSATSGSSFTNQDANSPTKSRRRSAASLSQQEKVVRKTQSWVCDILKQAFATKVIVFMDATRTPFSLSFPWFGRSSVWSGDETAHVIVRCYHRLMLL